MNRKIVGFVMAAGILVFVSLAQAQQGRIYRVGVLGPPGQPEGYRSIKGLRDGLREAGYLEGKNLQLNVPNVKTYDELRPIAKGYVEKKTDVIVTHGGTATGIGKGATREIPIVIIWGVRDPVQAGFVKSLASPETNITGLISSPGVEIEGKLLELFKEAVPTLKRVVLLYNARGESPVHEMRLAVVRKAAPKLGLKMVEKPIRSAGEVGEALVSVSKETTDGIYVISSGLFRNHCQKMVAIGMQKKLPLVGCDEAEQGPLLSYRADEYRGGHRGAWYVDRILKGAKPADLPVEQPTKFEFIINLRTAKQIGLMIPPNVLARADRVIK